MYHIIFTILILAFVGVSTATKHYRPDFGLWRYVAACGRAIRKTAWCRRACIYINKVASRTLVAILQLLKSHNVVLGIVVCCITSVQASVYKETHSEDYRTANGCVNSRQSAPHSSMSECGADNIPSLKRNHASKKDTWMTLHLLKKETNLYHNQIQIGVRQACNNRLISIKYLCYETFQSSITNREGKRVIRSENRVNTLRPTACRLNARRS